MASNLTILQFNVMTISICNVYLRDNTFNNISGMIYIYIMKQWKKLAIEYFMKSNGNTIWWNQHIRLIRMNNLATVPFRYFKLKEREENQHETERWCFVVVVLVCMNVFAVVVFCFFFFCCTCSSSRMLTILAQNNGLYNEWYWCDVFWIIQFVWYSFYTYCTNIYLILCCQYCCLDYLN